MTQNQKVLAALIWWSITQDDANKFGCYRLAARINDLRGHGHEIRTVMEPHSGGNHARYFLKRSRNA